MVDRVWIVFDRKQVLRMNKTNKLSLGRGEKYACIDIRVDDSVFSPPPMLTAALVLSGSTVGEVGTIAIDPNDGLPGPSDAQGSLNVLAARLLDKAINSTDPSLKELALNSLAICRESGIEVRIEIPEETVG